jgi:hypothetical protein
VLDEKKKNRHLSVFCVLRDGAPGIRLIFKKLGGKQETVCFQQYTSAGGGEMGQTIQHHITC